MTTELQRATDPTPAEAPACPVCVHGDASHGTNGRRFCAATMAGALTRGCICRER